MAEDKFETPSERAPDGRQQAEDGSQQPSDPRVAELENELRRKSEEAAANLDRLMRAAADAENFKKRLQKEKGDAIRFANESLLRDLLQVIDSLELAVEHGDLGGNGKSVVEGVQLTLRLFRDLLERYGVKEIGDPAGATFDPSTQEAAEVRESSVVPPNTVIQQQTKGYRYNDRLLRPARVVVAGEAPGDRHTRGKKEPVD
jgi:molecular chaperone GrpE